MESKTKKKLATAIAGVAMVGAAVSLTAGTFSYFTTTAPTGVAVGAGHIGLDAHLDHAINFNNVSPGWHDETNTFTVQNTGTVPGKLAFKVINNGSDPGMLKAVQIRQAGTTGNWIPLAQGIGADVPTNVVLQPGSDPASVSFDLRFEDNGNQNGLQDKGVNLVLETTLQSVPNK